MNQDHLKSSPYDHLDKLTRGLKAFMIVATTEAFGSERYAKIVLSAFDVSHLRLARWEFLPKLGAVYATFVATMTVEHATRTVHLDLEQSVLEGEQPVNAIVASIKELQKIHNGIQSGEYWLITREQTLFMLARWETMEALRESRKQELEDMRGLVLFHTNTAGGGH